MNDTKVIAREFEVNERVKTLLEFVPQPKKIISQYLEVDAEVAAVTAHLSPKASDKNTAWLSGREFSG